MSSDTNAPLITGQRTIKTTLGALGVLLGLLATGLLAWSDLKDNVATGARNHEQHERRIRTLEDRAAVDHDILIEIRSDLKALRREQTR